MASIAFSACSGNTYRTNPYPLGELFPSSGTWTSATSPNLENSASTSSSVASNDRFLTNSRPVAPKSASDEEDEDESEEDEEEEEEEEEPALAAWTAGAGDAELELELEL